MLYHPQSEMFVQFLTNKLRKLTPVGEGAEPSKKIDAAKESSKAETAQTKAWGISRVTIITADAPNYWLSFKKNSIF